MIAGILLERKDEIGEDFYFVFDPQYGIEPAVLLGQLFQKYFLLRGRTPGIVEATVEVIDNDRDAITQARIIEGGPNQATTAHLDALAAAIAQLNLFDLCHSDPVGWPDSDPEHEPENEKG